MSYRIVLEKEDFKFSGTHFTIFGPGRAERLHGHNYRVRCEFRVSSLDPELEMAFDFNDVKPVLREITRSLDEFVLIPALSPHLRIERGEGNITIVFGPKLYVLPEEDVRLLPVTNLTSEALARHIAEELKSRLKTRPETCPETRPETQLKTKENGTLAAILSISIGVEETQGQGVYYETPY